MSDNEKELARRMSPLALAFLGDAVYELKVRSYFVRMGGMTADVLHRRTVELVRADAQAKAVASLLPHLTQEEQDILRRGRNANAAHVPKHTDPVSYRHATGFEALFGYIYLCGDEKRLDEIFNLVLELLQTPEDGAARCTGPA